MVNPKLFALVVVASLCHVASAEEVDLNGLEKKRPCTPLRTCGQCAFDSECGWCESSGRCVQGTQFGPIVGNCTEWHFTYCRDEPCLIYNGVGCSACIRDPFCGWCEDTGLCVEGTAGGPLTDDCIAWHPNDCPSEFRREDLIIPPKWTNKGGDPVQLL
eukprot:c17455_g1_i1.p1 GENE.c17455_g1_i1~~c17455_g1_i1.p1  ORF type:complete len:172 (+),score=32.94 c17455_g1_i1:42-518(+)